MDIILETPGSRIGKKQEMIHINVPNQNSVDIPIREVESIVLSQGVQITSQALKSLSSYAINIVYTSGGKPYGLYTPFANVGTVYTRRQQILAYDDWRGRHLAIQFVYATLENKRRLLLYFAKNRKNSNKAKAIRLRAGARRIGKYIDTLLKYSKSIKKGTKLKDIRQILMGMEGNSTRVYFQEYGNLFPEDFWTIRRTRRPPRDPVNSLLSLGYTIMQSYITIGIAAAGLELYAGFLHSDRSGKPSLALDLLEEFRQPVVDRLVAKLLLKKQIKIQDFENTFRGFSLKDEQRKFYYQELRREITGNDQTEILFGDSEEEGVPKEEQSQKRVKLNYKKAMVDQARKIANYLIGSTSTYKPFLMSW
jgi:CRISPR-associated protein Cas1